MRIHSSLLILTLVAGVAVNARAQTINAARVAVVNMVDLDRRSAPALPLRVATDSSTHGCATTCTVLIGAVAGGVAGAGIVASQLSHSEEDVGGFSGPAIVISVVLGMVVGALAGFIVTAVR
ncbi:MAG: hypothetical protein M3Z05_06875 [Gemmatimonadota bacterium]|nr:hypothetical protein [Gemmatimonadota bacterium]